MNRNVVNPDLSIERCHSTLS